MDALGGGFRDWVLSRDIEGCTITALDDDRITLDTDELVGAVSFYRMDCEPDIVELSVVRKDCDCEPVFFLHFELEDEARAEELFNEMAEELARDEQYDTQRVLLCCTAGMTTTLFASKLSEAAKTLSLDYSFEALPLEQAKTGKGGYDAVLLAPQVGYQRKAVADAFPEAVVVQVPTKIFASYDAGAALKMVMHLLSDNTVLPNADVTSLKAVRDLKNDMRIMVVTVVNRPRNTWMGWRIYDKGEIVGYGSVTKPKHDLRDVEDLLATLHWRGWNVSDLDAVGIAVPGVVNRGSITFGGKGTFDYELGRTLSERYHTKVFVDNNANAGAVGCYVSQDTYDSVVLHTQQTGYHVGGQGIVVDGHLAKGRKNFAGELGPLYGSIHGTRIADRDPDLPWTPEGMLDLVAPILAADCSLISPDAIYVAVDLLDDMDVLRNEMCRYFHGLEEYMPDLVRVTDYRERIALGEMALCLQKLRNPRPHRKN